MSPAPVVSLPVLLISPLFLRRIAPTLTSLRRSVDDPGPACPPYRGEKQIGIPPPRSCCCAMRIWCAPPSRPVPLFLQAIRADIHGAVPGPERPSPPYEEQETVRSTGRKASPHGKRAARAKTWTHSVRRCAPAVLASQRGRTGRVWSGAASGGLLTDKTCAPGEPLFPRRPRPIGDVAAPTTC
ncbi:hypothetical protein FB451DRAFT_1238194 [Mycena latifolia]|nr:hypothetical protein FB451DRAFT_1238194 [Mycena latifolia]